MKRKYFSPELRVVDFDLETQFLNTLDGPGGSDMDIKNTDPDLWG